LVWARGSRAMLKNYKEQILLAGDLDLILKAELGILKKEIMEIE
jgi:hypothetical protein